jgi:hypothetical protein
LGRSAELSFVKFSGDGSLSPVTFSQPVHTVDSVALKPVSIRLSIHDGPAALFDHGTAALGSRPGRFFDGRGQ